MLRQEFKENFSNKNSYEHQRPDTFDSSFIGRLLTWTSDGDSENQL